MLSFSSAPLSARELAALLAVQDRFDPSPENALLRQYIEDGCAHGDPLPLALGETWRGPPQQLIELLASAPFYCDGYLLSPLGLPACQDAVSHWLCRDYGLNLESEALTVGVTPTGTRSVMHAFGAWLINDHWKHQSVHLTSFLPSWDYRGVFCPLGFVDNPIALTPEQGFAPDMNAIDAAIHSVPPSARQLIVLNPQHNPTAIGWSEDIVTSIIEIANRVGAAILVDDAYFGLTDAGVTPTSALRAYVHSARSKEKTAPFFLVRSLGKQFNCNGWSVGAFVGSAAGILGTQRQIAARNLNTGGRMQWALSRWIDSELADHDVMRRRELQRQARHCADVALADIGLDPCDIIRGDTAPFMAFKVPHAFRNATRPAADFLAHAAERGVYFSPLLPSGGNLGREPGDLWARLYLGVGPQMVDEAIRRSQIELTSLEARHYAG